MLSAELQVESLLVTLRTLPDFRDPLGREFSLVTLGFCLFVTELAKVGSQRRRARWLAVNWSWCKETLEKHNEIGIPERAPSQSSLSRALSGIDLWALMQRHLKLVREHIKQLSAKTKTLRHYAVDGKRREGIRSAQTGRTELDVTIFDVASRSVLAKSHASDKRGEVKVFRRLLRSFGLELSPGIFTMDAGLTSPATFTWIRSRGHEYLAAIKGNCGHIFELAQQFNWSGVTCFRTVETAHGRHEIRELQRISLAQTDDAEEFEKYIDCGSVIRLASTRTEISTGVVSFEMRYFVVSKGIAARPLPILAKWIRAHWSQENHLHWAKDAILGEDHAREKSPRSSRVLGFLKDIVISLAFSLKHSVSELTDMFQFRPSMVWRSST